MTIKPVLVPDHDAASLRKLMDSFATASTGPTRQELTESRAAVAAAQGVTEGVFDIFKKLPPSGSIVKIDGRPVEISYGSHGGEDNSHVNFSWNDTNGKEHYVEARVEEIKNLRALAERIKGEMDWVEQQNAKQGVAEAKPDVMRHTGDKTIKIVKRRGVPVGEIGTDAEASEGNGSYYVKLYDGSYDAVGFDSAEEALAELRAAISEGITETADVEESSTKNVTGVMKKYLPKSMWAPILSHTGKSKHDNADGSKTSHVWRLRNLVRSFRGREFDAWKQAVEQELGDGYEVTSEWPTPSVRYIQMNEAHIQTGVTETADVKYGVFAKGGSVGSQRFRDDPLKTFDTKEEATADARRRRSGLSKGERGYYGMGYVVKPIRGDVDEGVIDNIKNTVRAANYDRLARRSNSQAVAGGGLAPPTQFRALSAKGDQRAQKAQDIRKGDVAESVDPIEQLRADILRFSR